MKYESLKVEAKREVDKFVFNVMDAIVKNTEREVKKGFLDFPKPPIETGTLRRSITGKVLSQDSKQVIGEVRASTVALVTSKGKKGGREVEYAKYVEYGTVKMQPRPFMRNGIARAEKKNEQIIINRTKNR